MRVDETWARYRTPARGVGILGQAKYPIEVLLLFAAGMRSIAALSSREREIVLLAARGLSNSDVALNAHIGESTVKTRLSSILNKRGFTSRAQIVAHVHKNGLLRSTEAMDGSAAS
ncbi:LuxR C-terminal-related transcriptional regulator [Cryobacterium sp. PH31-O1]|uniref:response regulator transcription factor n=1 Tax=Cryobacterium sp. PH31-O1 TaxID=3046306 RepID=UPI0024B99712|nr:LuxR C-terminal-related transcriptional regulator [Cryobacterium sp. PH31-O1]MDJ0337967.1 LuxR C-terminal-related transcriptional regulator [Cryobacterium sp. PH31-O1]